MLASSARCLRRNSAWACCASASLALLACSATRSSGGLGILGLQIPRDSFARLFGLGCHQLTALGRQPLRNLVFNLFARPRDRLLLVAQRLGLPGDLGVLGGELLLKALPRFL